MDRHKFIGGVVLCAAAGLWIGGSFAADAVTLDFSQTCGPVKPVNGIGHPPMAGALGGWGMLHYLKEAGIPYTGSPTGRSGTSRTTCRTGRAIRAGTRRSTSISSSTARSRRI